MNQIEYREAVESILDIGPGKEFMGVFVNKEDRCFVYMDNKWRLFARQETEDEECRFYESEAGEILYNIGR
jgi:hypothetical protein